MFPSVDLYVTGSVIRCVASFKPWLMGREGLFSMLRRFYEKESARTNPLDFVIFEFERPAVSYLLLEMLQRGEFKRGKILQGWGVVDDVCSE